MKKNESEPMDVLVQPMVSDSLAPFSGANARDYSLPVSESLLASNRGKGGDRISFFILAEDPKLRANVRGYLDSSGLESIEFNSLERFQGLVSSEPNGVIIADFRLATEKELAADLDPQGIRLLKFCKNNGWNCPVLFVAESGAGGVADCAAAFSAGAFAYLEMPLNRVTFDQHIEKSIEELAQRKLELDKQLHVTNKLSLLTSREREILNFLVDGLSMKTIASNSGTSFQAVARHRQRILEKLNLEGDVALVRWFFNLGERKIHSLDPYSQHNQMT